MTAMTGPMLNVPFTEMSGKPDASRSHGGSTATSPGDRIGD
jgi:hypothetical protein